MTVFLFKRSDKNIVKGLLFVALLLGVLSTQVRAEYVPSRVSLQVSLLDQNGYPLDGIITRVDVSLYSDDTVVEDWSEKHNNVEFVDGVGVLELGSVSPLDATYFDIATPKFVLKVDGDDVDPIYLNSVMYALKSSSTDHVEWEDVEGVPDSLVEGDYYSQSEDMLISEHVTFNKR